jgi:hypothetical protein
MPLPPLPGLSFATGLQVTIGGTTYDVIAASSSITLPSITCVSSVASVPAAKFVQNIEVNENLSVNKSATINGTQTVNGDHFVTGQLVVSSGTDFRCGLH